MSKPTTRSAWSKPLTAPPGIVDKKPVRHVMRERFLHLQLSLVGQKVTVTLTNGAVIDGILHTFTPFESMAMEHRNKYVIKAAHVIKGDVDIKGGTLIIGADKVSNLHVKSIRLEQSSRKADSFQTDTDISSGGINVRDDFVMAGNAWTSAGAESEGNGRAGLFGTKIGDLSGKIGQWDQFQANEKKFGVKASFDENLYTTSLDKNTVDKKKQEEAERLAREIESQATSNMHLAEERGQMMEGDYDEEDLYSGVLVADKGGKETKERTKLVLKPRAVQNTVNKETSKPAVNPVSVAKATPTANTVASTKAVVGTGNTSTKSNVAAPMKTAAATSNPSTVVSAPKTMNWAAMVAKSDSKKANTIPKQTMKEEKNHNKEVKVQMKKEENLQRIENKVQSQSKEDKIIEAKPDEKPQSTSEEPIRMKLDEKIEIKPREQIEIKQEEKTKTNKDQNVPETDISEESGTQKVKEAEEKKDPEETQPATKNEDSKLQKQDEETPSAESKVDNTDDKEPEKPKSKLNANAKSFTFNPSAKSFTPSFSVPTPAPAMHPAPMDPQLAMMQPQYMQYPGTMPGPMMYPPGAYHPQMQYRPGGPSPYGMMQQNGGMGHLGPMPGVVSGEDNAQSNGEGGESSSASTEGGNKGVADSADSVTATQEGEEITGSHEPALDQNAQFPPQQLGQHFMHGMAYPGGPGYYGGGMPMVGRGPGQQHYHPQMVGGPQQIPVMPRNYMFQVPPQHMHQSNMPQYNQMRGPSFPGQPFMQGGYPGHPMEGDDVAYRGGRGGRGGRGNRRIGRGRGNVGGRGKYGNYNNPNPQRSQDSASETAEASGEEITDHILNE